jgi:hypothetical protein
MPQFDFFSFYTQIFWTFIFICLFYLIYLKFPIKNLSELFSTRIQLLKARTVFSGKEFEVSEKFFYFYQNVLSKRVAQKNTLVKKI